MHPESFVAALARASFGNAFNFYRLGAGAELRCERLHGYLDSRVGAPLLLVGEAPGYRGARVSGLPFTSERQVSGNAPGEATATIVHRVLGELGLEKDTLLWNVVPAHPHRHGEPDSNRPPTRAEIMAGWPFLTALCVGRKVIPVGRVAGVALGMSWIRHPARGGSSEFAEGLLECSVGGRLVRRFSCWEPLRGRVVGRT